MEPRRAQRERLIAGLRRLQAEGTFCDFTIVCSGRVFRAHRNVLHAASVYFQCLFQCSMQEAVSGRLQLDVLDPDNLRDILHFMYTGEVLREWADDADRLYPMLWSTHFLQVYPLLRFCWDEVCLHRLSIDNYAEVWEVADMQDCDRAKVRVARFAALNFAAVIARRDAFLALPLAMLRLVLEQHPEKRLPVDGVLNSLCAWVQHDEARRCPYIANLLEHLDLTKVSNSYLVETLTSRKKCWQQSVVDYFSSSKRIYSLFMSISETRLLLSPGAAAGLTPSSPSGPSLLFCGRSRDETETCFTTYMCTRGCWSPATTFPYPTSRLSVHAGDCVYFLGCGRRDQPPSKTCCRYNVKRGSIASIADSIYAIRQAGAAKVNGRLFVVGGVHASGVLTAVQCYDPATNLWCLQAPTTERHNHPCVLNLGNTLYVLGSLCCSAVERYDAVENRWTIVQVIAEPWGGWSRAVSFQGRVAVYKRGVNDNQIFLYDPERNAWSNNYRYVPPIGCECVVNMWGGAGYPYVFLLTAGRQLLAWNPLTREWKNCGRVSLARNRYWNISAVF